MLNVDFAIMGGTFDPIHHGHINAALSVSRLWKLKVFLMPAADPPHKHLAHNSASPSQRLDMTRLASSLHDQLDVSDIEIRAGVPRFTVDTLQLLQTVMPGRPLLILGGDMLRSFTQWKDFRLIFKLASIAAVPRTHDEFAQLLALAQALMLEFSCDIRLADTVPFDISSTTIRYLVASHRPFDQFVPAPVARYILDNHLYL